MMWHDNWSGPNWALAVVLMLLGWVALAAVVAWLFARARDERVSARPADRAQTRASAGSAVATHGERQVQDGLDLADDHSRRAARAPTVGRRAAHHRTVIAVAIGALALTAVSTAVLARTGHTARSHASASSCVTPNLPGSIVDVQLADMRSMMGGAMMGGQHGLLSQNDWSRFRHGMMTLTATPMTAHAGTVSLRVTNTGYLTHELVVLPLAVGQRAGQRSIGSDGKVDESGSLGEASATCAAGAGDGIASGSSGWTTLSLPAGRYELVCNLPGHYAGGMWTELDIA
jgi:uncharacterized cupredoxin-like copper-binding protein